MLGVEHKGIIGEVKGCGIKKLLTPHDPDNPVVRGSFRDSYGTMINLMNIPFSGGLKEDERQVR